MVAAHLGDLRAAKEVGLKTAFVIRPLEYGPEGKPDLKPDASVDLSAKDFNDLASTAWRMTVVSTVVSFSARAPEPPGRHARTSRCLVVEHIVAPAAASTFPVGENATARTPATPAGSLKSSSHDARIPQRQVRLVRQRGGRHIR